VELNMLQKLNRIARGSHGPLVCEISRSHSGVAEDSSLLWSDDLFFGCVVPKFRRNVVSETTFPKTQVTSQKT
jgi:hypothetical protein